MHAQTGVDLVTGLHSKVATVFGRPKWDKIFKDIKVLHPGKRVGVFVCGPTVRPQKEHDGQGLVYELP